jgi:hypothetical protein
MNNIVFLLCCGAFVFVGSFVWDSIIDRTVRHKPSDWLGYFYLAVISVILGFAFKYLDEIRSHPYRSTIIALIAVGFTGWLTVRLWRKAACWDKDFEGRSRNRDRH